jgi:hypothetical protein
MKIGIAVLLPAIAIALLQPVYAQDELPPFSEGVVLIGTSLVPKELGNVGAGYLAGWGERHAISVEFSYSHLNDYAVGFGKAFGQPFLTSPVSHSREYDFSFGYQFELLPRGGHHSIVAPYLTAGGGYVHSSFVTTPEDHFGFLPPPQPTTFYSRGWAPFVGGGIRIPVDRGFGVRAELREWIVPSVTLFNGYEPYGFSAPSDSLTRLSIGLFYRR